MYLFPEILSPTCRIKTDTSVTFAGLTDASASSENQGDINRSLCNYSPDISFHVQAMLKLKNLSKLSNYDIWMLIMYNEDTSSSSSSSSSSYSDYYNSLLYSNYYNNMYSGYSDYGYGSYGSYGYSNYYNYLLAAAYSSSSSSSSSSTSSSLDKDRYYKCYLNGPTAQGEKPVLIVTYALPKATE
jgi:hypothetical protein